MDQAAYWLGYWSPFIFGFMVLSAIMWFVVPFAIFAIRRLLKDILKELKRANDYAGTRPR